MFSHSHPIYWQGLALLLHVCYTAHMITKIDTLGHLPRVHASQWEAFTGGFDRHVNFDCEHGNRRYAVLKVYEDDGATHQIVVMIDGRGRYLSVGSHVDAFSTANETLVGLAGKCDCHND